MKPIRTLLTASLSLALAMSTLAQEAPGPPLGPSPDPEPIPHGIELFKGPTSVITQDADGNIRCEVGAQPIPVAIDDPIPVPLYIDAAMANNQFAFDLYADLAEQQLLMPGNIFFSPLSVNAALSLTYEGVAGNTQAQFEQVLHLPQAIDRAGYHQSMASLLGQLDGEDTSYELTLANGLWGERTMPYSNAFTDTLAEHYDAGFESVDFIGNPDAQRQHINAWVQEQTNDRIVDLLPEGSVDGLTRLVLANAIYFNAAWQHPFNERLTEQLPFHVPANPLSCTNSVGGEPTSTMTLPRASLRYADLDGLDIVELPYQGADLSMLILLPDEVRGLAGLEAQLSAQALNEWVGQLELGQVRVQMPTWEMNLSTELSPTLQRLGMTDAFDADAADFSRLSDSDTSGLSISGVFHQAFIRVDEQGTEAAAATAILIRARSARLDEPFRFTADHPFVYVIRHNETGAVLFIGRVVSPVAPAGDDNTNE